MKVDGRNRWAWIGSCFVASLPAVLLQPAGAEVTLTCEPDIVIASPGDVVTVECYLETDAALSVVGTQVNLPCSLPGGILGDVTVADVVPGCTGGVCIDISRPDWILAGVTAFPAVNLTDCTAANAALSPVALAAGARKYMATYTYLVSPCASGEFRIEFEEFTIPPDQDDTTKIRDGNNDLVPFIPLVNTTTVPVGQCCTGIVCIGDMNQECCEIDNGGRWDPNLSCSTDACPCTSNADCDNGIFCDGAEICVNQSCQAGSNPCTNPNFPLCDEVNDLCGECLTNADCDDGVFCNGQETCQLGLCVDGANEPSGTPCGDPRDDDCTDPDTCNGFGTCVANNQPNGTQCEDGEFCTVGTTCSGGVCSGGGPRNCSDGLSCTSDSCDEDGDTCVNTLNPGFCLIGGACIADGASNPANECEMCNTASSTTDWSVKADGTACTDDGNDCTSDECLSGVCAHDNLPAQTPCDDGDPCTGTGGEIGFDECDGNGNCVGQFDPECNDDCDTAVEVFDGSTPGSNTNSGADQVEASCQPDSNADIWFKYTATCTGPVHVNTEGSAFAPSNDTVLSIYDACGGNEIACDDDGGSGLLSALTFSASEGVMYWIRVAGFENNVGDVLLNIQTINDCVIDGQCYAEDDPNPANPCEVCRPDISTTAWSAALAGTLCGDPSDTDCDAPDACDGMGNCEVNFKPDGTACTDEGNECTEDVCSAGTCVHNLLPVGTACGDPADTECDNPDSCDANGICQSNLESAGTPCGDPSDTDCNNPDTCDGAGACQVNFEADGTACTDDGIECTDDQCLTGACDHPNKPAGEPCGDPADTNCDNPDTCDGNGICLENHELDGTECVDGDICTEGDVCITGVCEGTPIPERPLVSALGARYIEVTPQPMGSIAPQSLKLTSPDFPCLLKWIQPDGSLDDTPVSQLPDDWGTLVVTGIEIVPSTLYVVEGVCGLFTTPGGSAVTHNWGDVDGNGFIDVDDILLSIAAFAGDFSPLEAADFFPCEPNGVIDVDDILTVLLAFEDDTYPCPDPC